MPLLSTKVLCVSNKQSDIVLGVPQGSLWITFECGFYLHLSIFLDSFFIMFYYVYVCFWGGVWTCECWRPWSPDISGPPDVELQEVVSCPSWVLGTELWSFIRAVPALNHGDRSPV